jgi:ferritin
MLSKKMEDALNQQIALEGNASAIYLAMASWCETQALSGCASFLYEQSNEERMHMLKILHYINEMDGEATVPAQQKPQSEYASIQELFKAVYAQEKIVTQAIYNLLSISKEESDHATTLFLQWYVAEQREEEAQVRAIMDKIKLIGTGPQSLFFIDQEIEKINQQRGEEEEEEAAAL